MSSKKLLLLVPVIALASCNGGGNYGDRGASAPAPEAFASKSDTTAVTAANAPINSSARKIIHTADFNCKVKDVLTATTKLEQLVKSVDGVVQESHMENSGYDSRTSFYTVDSLRETRTYTTTAHMILRVPSANLDSVINAIPGLTSFIDTRNLKQSDVTYQYLSNELKNQVGSNNKSGKSKNAIAAQVYDDNRTEQKIDRKIENMHLADDISYATVTVAFSQPEQVLIQTVVNPDYFAKPPFRLQCMAALNTGWQIIRAFCLVVITIWPVVLLMIAGWMAYRKLRGRHLAVAKK